MSRWYIIHAYSGFENKVREQILADATRMGLEAFVDAVEVPTETVTEVRRGKKVQAERKFFPGYVLAKLRMSDDVYNALTNAHSRQQTGQSRYPACLPIAEVRIIVDGATMKALIPTALLAAIPMLAHADPIETGPFYLRHDAATADREDIMAVVIDAQKLTDGTIYLCSTSASVSVGRRKQKAVRAELITNGLSSAIIRIGRRCELALRHPPISKAAKDAVVVIVGPSVR